MKLSPNILKFLITDNFIYESSIISIQYYFMDYVGGDYYRIEDFTDPHQLFCETYNDPEAKGFNTKGYIKNRIQIDGLKYNEYLEGGGIYVYLNRLSDTQYINI